MQVGVLPQAERMCACIRMLVHQPGVGVIQMQGLVIVVVVTVALRMDRQVVQLSRPMRGNPGREQRSRLPDNSQHQKECANWARHGLSLTASTPTQTEQIPLTDFGTVQLLAGAWAKRA